MYHEFPKNLSSPSLLAIKSRLCYNKHEFRRKNNRTGGNLVKKRYLPVFTGLLVLFCILAFAAGTGTETPERTTENPSAAGWQSVNGLRYYYHEDGTMATGWLELDSGKYYFRGSGSMVTGWLSLEGQRYYLRADGAAATGLSEIGGQTYLFDETGMLATGVIQLDGVRYLADENGHPQSGWAQDGTMWCYFDEDGRAATGWQTIGSFEYYFYSDGSPACGITQLEGETCYFSSRGQYIPLVNPWHDIPEGYTVELTSIDANHKIASIACADYEEMMADCRAAGLDPAVCSSYRTQEYQEILYNRKVSYYLGKGHDQEEAQELAGHSVAYPGTSEHQLGLALDIIDSSNWNLNESQAKTATQKWLMENSWRYGWILRYPDGKSDITGIIYEPWHYRYVGKPLAEELHNSGLTLEEYFASLS